MKVCFIGHKTIENKEKNKKLLKEVVLTLIEQGVTTFLFGSMSEFDELSWEVVTEIKKEKPFIKRVYVRSDFANISESYEKYLFRFYEKTYFPQKIEKAGKCSYVERNYEMIDNSDFCIFYFNKNYVPTPLRKSGTQIAYSYAEKKKKKIINLYE